jgi:DMSO/TMAO reductase YedYZ heme-binding membrane subunit
MTNNNSRNHNREIWIAVAFMVGIAVGMVLLICMIV